MPRSGVLPSYPGRWVPISEVMLEEDDLVAFVSLVILCDRQTPFITPVGGLSFSYGHARWYVLVPHDANLNHQPVEVIMERLDADLAWAVMMGVGETAVDFG